MKEGRNLQRSLKPLPPVSGEKLPEATLVVARYQEDLSWLAKVDRRIQVIVYNKGSQISDKTILRRIDQLSVLPNRGREADTYLAHLENARTPQDGTHTIFCQGNPFPHSPDFLKLLGEREHWADVQCLTAAYDASCNVPPEILRKRELCQWLGRFRVRTELFSLWTLQPIAWHDHLAMGWMEGFRKKYGAVSGWNICGHFLELAGLHDLAKEAWTHYTGQFAFGAMFAIADYRLDSLPQRSLTRLRRMASEEPFHGYLFERFWLHLFGLPFLMREDSKLEAISRLTAK